MERTPNGDTPRDTSGAGRRHVVTHNGQFMYTYIEGDKDSEQMAAAKRAECLRKLGLKTPDQAAVGKKRARPGKARSPKPRPVDEGGADAKASSSAKHNHASADAKAEPVQRKADRGGKGTGKGKGKGKRKGRGATGKGEGEGSPADKPDAAGKAFSSSSSGGRDDPAEGERNQPFYVIWAEHTVDEPFGPDVGWSACKLLGPLANTARALQDKRAVFRLRPLTDWGHCNYTPADAPPTSDRAPDELGFLHHAVDLDRTISAHFFAAVYEAISAQSKGWDAEESTEHLELLNANHYIPETVIDMMHDPQLCQPTSFYDVPRTKSMVTINVEVDLTDYA